MSTCAETSDTMDNDKVEIAVAVVIPLLMVGVVNTLIVVCIVACHKSPNINNRIKLKITCRKVKRYHRPKPHSLSHARSDVHSATELTLNMESQTNDAEMNQSGSGEAEENMPIQVKRQSTISQQNEAYGIHEFGIERSTATQQNQNGSGEAEENIPIQVKRQSTISQQNEAYGILHEFGTKRSTLTQHNEAYGLTKTAGTPPTVAFNTKQPDAGQESDEYSYVRFERTKF